MTSTWPRDEAERAIRNMECDDSVVDLEALPTFLARHILNPSGKFADTKLVCVDSVQGDGLNSFASRKYQRFYEFCRACKSAQITVVAVGHITKSGKLAGPKNFEHFCDLVVRIEKVADYRLCAVTKNRFGAERPRGIPLLIDSISTALVPSPHREPVTGVARSYLGAQHGATELQASVGLPMPGTRPAVVAPDLPKKRLEQLVAAIARMPSLAIDQFDLNINALLPGDSPRYRSWLGLPMAIALIASVIRRTVPGDAMYFGEIDLDRRLRPLPSTLIETLGTAIHNGEFTEKTRFFVPTSAVEPLTAAGAVLVQPCDSLDVAAHQTWADLH
jgi:DNA repair protein RadA/Sms